MAKDTEKDEIESKYEELAKKFKLPKFMEIDQELEISALDSENFLLKNILRRTAEKLEFYIDFIGSLVHPDGSSISSIYEMRFFSDNEKNEMYLVFKKMMKQHRHVIELLLSNNEKEQAQFLNEFFDEWAEIKAKLISYLGKMKESWEKESSIEEDLGYFG